MRSFRTVAVLPLLLVATLSCGASQPAGPPTAPTTSGSESSSATPATPGPPTAAGDPTVADRVSSPDQGVRQLVAAWQRGDRAAAGKIATPGVVTTLFARPAPATAPRFDPCTLDVPARFVCTVVPPGGPGLQLVVEGGASAGYTVSGLTVTG